MSRCSDCDVLVCDSCVPAHARSAPSTAHHVITFSDVTRPVDVTSEMATSGGGGGAEEAGRGGLESGALKCGSHGGQTLAFYCFDCETAVCEVIV